MLALESLFFGECTRSWVRGTSQGDNRCKDASIAATTSVQRARDRVQSEAGKVDRSNKPLSFLCSKTHQLLLLLLGAPAPTKARHALLLKASSLWAERCAMARWVVDPCWVVLLAALFCSLLCCLNGRLIWARVSAAPVQK